MATMEGDQCPVCKSDRYLNPNLKLLVSPCFHKMCQNCIDRLYTAGPAPCPVCKQTLRKSNFVAQTFEDLYVEKEVQIRKKVGKYFNKRLEDFGGSLKKYNDYLEEVEDILFNLINDVDVQQTYERIEKFRQENKDIIATNLSKQMNEEKAIAYRLEKEKKEKQLRKEAYLAQIKEDEKWKAVEKEEILRQLASSEKSAKDIIAETIAKRPQHSAHLLDLPGMQDDYIEDGDTQWGDYGDFDPMDHIYEDLHTLNVLDSYNDP